MFAGLEREFVCRVLVTSLTCCSVALAEVGERAAARAESEQASPRLERVRLVGDPAWRHAATVTHILPLSDGKRVLTSARDASARLWDLETGREIERFFHRDAGNEVWCVMALPGENEILTAGESGEVTRWRIDTGERTGRYRHGQMVFRIAVSPDGKHFVSTDTKGNCVLWDVARTNEVRRFSGSTESLYAAAFTPTDVITGSEDGYVRFWDRTTGKSRKAAPHGDSDIFTLTCSPDRSRMAVCMDKPQIEIWDTARAEVQRRISLPDDARAAAWSPDGARMAAVCDNKRVYVFDMEAGQLAWEKALPGETHWAVAFSAEGGEVLCGCDHLVIRLSADDGSPVFPADKAAHQTAGIRHAVAGPGGDLLYLLAGTRGITVWDARSGTRLHEWVSDKRVRKIDVSPDGKHLVAVLDRECVLIDAGSGAITRRLATVQYGGAATFAFQGQAVLLGMRDGKLVLLRREDGRRLRAKKGHTDNVSINHVAVSPDGRCAATAGSDGTVCLWDLRTGEVIETLKAPTGRGKQSSSSKNILECRFDPADGRSIMAVQDRRLCYWKALGEGTQAMGEDSVHELIAELGSDSFEEREEATLKLIAAGESVLGIVEKATSEDPEVRGRLKRVARTVMLERQYPEKPAVLELKGAVRGVQFGPGGYWIAAVNLYAESLLVVGRIEHENPVALQTVNDGCGACSLSRDPTSGRIFVGNLNGTVSEFEFVPPATFPR